MTSECNYEIIRPNYVIDDTAPIPEMCVICAFEDQDAYEKYRKFINRVTLLSYSTGWKWCIAKSTQNCITKCLDMECTDISQQTNDAEFTNLMCTQKLMNWINCHDSDQVLSTLVCRDDLRATISRCSSVYPVVVLFFADWCGHCTEFKNKWNNVVTSCFDTSPCCWIACNEKDASVRSNLQHYGIKGYPTVQLHYNGRVVEMSGPRTEEALMEFSRRY